MADINDRLERLNRRDELTRRILRRGVPEPVAQVGEDFAEVVQAVVEVVRRHPGMSIMMAPGDGRRGGAVVQVSERAGQVDVSVVPSGPGSPDQVAPG